MTRKEEREQAAENAHLDIYEKSIDTFIKGAEWADETMIQKACNYLNKELPTTDLSSSNMLDIEFKVFDKENKRCFINKFRNYMKGG